MGMYTSAIGFDSQFLASKSRKTFTKYISWNIYLSLQIYIWVGWNEIIVRNVLFFGFIHSADLEIASTVGTFADVLNWLVLASGR